MVQPREVKPVLESSSANHQISRRSLQTDHNPGYERVNGTILDASNEHSEDEQTTIGMLSPEPPDLATLNTEVQNQPTFNSDKNLEHISEENTISHLYNVPAMNWNMDLTVDEYLGRSSGLFLSAGNSCPRIESSYKIDLQTKKRIASSFLKKHHIVIGIPSADRSTSYLIETVNQLFHYSGEMLPYITVVLFNAEYPPENHKQILEIRERFQEHLINSKLVLLEMRNLHKQLLEPMLQTYDDSIDRVYWRSKQVLDYAYLMESSAPFGDVYIQLEDDIEVAEDFITEIAWWTATYYWDRNDWFQLSFYGSDSHQDHEKHAKSSTFYGFIGQLFRTSDLLNMAKYFREHFDSKPVDWLLNDYLVETTRSLYKHVPSVFNHIGKVSSLPGKFQDLKAAFFASPREMLDFPSSQCPILDHEQKLKQEGEYWLRNEMAVLTIIDTDIRDRQNHWAETFQSVIERSLEELEENARLRIIIGLAQNISIQHLSESFNIFKQPELIHIVSLSAAEVHHRHRQLENAIGPATHVLFIEPIANVRKKYIKDLVAWYQEFYSTRSDWSFLFVGSTAEPTTHRHLVKNLKTLSGAFFRTIDFFKLLRAFEGAGSLISPRSLEHVMTVLQEKYDLRIFGFHPPLVIDNQ